MIRSFFVLSAKKIMAGILLISILIIFCMIGTSIVSNVVETAMPNRLLPIYSVETENKKVAITFDCAWSRSQ